MLELILINLIVVFIVDLSGFIQTIKERIRRRYYPLAALNDLNFKPFDCSLCMTFWTGTAYLILTHTFTLPLFSVVCLLAYFSKETGNFIKAVTYCLDGIIDKLFELI